MAIKSLGYVVIEASHPDRWHHFLTQGAGAMPVDGSEDGCALYRVDDRPFRFRVERGEANRLIAPGYQIDDEAALAALGDRIRAAGCPAEYAGVEVARSRCVDKLILTTDPAGNEVEFYCGEALAEAPFISPIGVPRFVTGAYGMGHAVLAAPNFEETHAFYRDVVGFHDTDLPHLFLMGTPDDPGIRFAFMHADNGRHHSIALGEMPMLPSGCVHLMLELPSLEEVERARERMNVGGYKESATLGRHMNDEMTSFYVQTPGGFDLEVGCEGLVIDPATWTPTAHTKVSEWGHEWAWQTEAAGAA